MEGISGTVMAYGQTASGKTFSMMGLDEEPGIIPLAVDDVFSYIREQADEREYLLRVAYIEIYNETINDLLSPSHVELRVMGDKKRGTYISPLTEEIVTTPTQVMKIIRKGEANRHFGSTDYNLKSSRSHTILQIIIESRDSSTQTATSFLKTKAAKGTVSISQLNLIDLAGSEKADTDTARRKEGAFINKSLLSLGNVISKITADKPTHIPYRDSKLTRVLQSSLSGNSKISVICTINPDEKSTDETISTLKFAARVKKIPIRAKTNHCLDDNALIQQYKSEISNLRQKLNDTNKQLEMQRSNGDLTQLIAERALFEEKLHQSHLVRVALKERIEHLTRMFLTSGSVIPSILEWSGGGDGNDKRSSIIMEGLLPSSIPSTLTADDSFEHQLPFSTHRHRSLVARTSRMSRQMSDAQFYKKHISEIVSRDEKITSLTNLLRILKIRVELTM